MPHPDTGGASPGQCCVIRDSPLQRSMPDGIRIAHHRWLAVHSVDDKADFAVFDHVHDMRTTFRNFVHHFRRNARRVNHPRRATRCQQGKPNCTSERAISTTPDLSASRTLMNTLPSFGILTLAASCDLTKASAKVSVSYT